MNVSHRVLTSIATIAIVLFVQGSPGLTRPFRSVQEHFLGIPFPLLPLSPENRQHYLRYATVDVPNGYIRYRASDNPEQFEFAIFCKSNRQYLAAFSIPYDPESFPGQPGLSQLILLDYRQGQWRDVTREILPVPVDRTLTYQLPRVGRDIVVVNRRQERLYRLRWQNDRFVRLGT